MKGLLVSSPLKANHSFRRNAQFTLYTAHPLLGTIMAILAETHLTAGSEVLVNYGYNKELFAALNIAMSDQECSKVTAGTSVGC